MTLARTCRSCGKVTAQAKGPKNCPKCHTPFGPITFGLDHPPGPPPALSEKEKREMSDLLRKPPAGGTRG